MPLSPAAPSASGEEAHRAAHRSVGPAVAMLRGAGLTRNTTGGAPAAALRSAAAGGVAVRAPSRREERSREKEKNTAERAFDRIGSIGLGVK